MRRKQQRTHATVTDVAKLARVSVATVSRTFSSPDIVTEEARQRVLQAAAALNYSPHPGARMLRSRKTHITAAIIPTLDHAIFATLVNTFQDVMTRAGHLVVVLSCGFDTAEIGDRVRLLVERGAEALMIVGRVDNPELVSYLSKRQIPIVSTYSYNSDIPFPSIGFDNAKAVRHMMNHRNFMFLSGPQRNNDRQAARISGFTEALRTEGLDPSGRIIECDYSFGRGADAFRAIRRERPETTCVICSSDVLAVGVLTECRRLGIRVPEDISVTGFDDIALAAITEPALTTIAVPAAQMGLLAAEALLQALTTGAPIRPVLIESSLIVRASTGSVSLAPNGSVAPARDEPTRLRDRRRMT